MDTNLSSSQSPISPPVHVRLGWVAGLLSLLRPGLGIVYSGKLRKGIFSFILFDLFFLINAYSVLYVYPERYGVFIFVLLHIFSIIIIILISVLDARKQPVDYKLKKFNKVYIYIIYAVSVSVILELSVYNFIKSYGTFSGSMEPTIFPGDKFIVSMCSYGIHIPKSDKYLFTFKEPQRNDVIAFNYRGTGYCKRCIGLPGDTISIKYRQLFINGEMIMEPYLKESRSPVYSTDVRQNNIFPSCCGWNQDNYGPICVPKKGSLIEITDFNFDSWKDFIISDIDIDYASDLSDSLTMIRHNGIYRVKNDYFFVLGDNRDNSLDSRFWGFIKASDIAGKIKLIYFSNIRMDIFWDRIGKRVE
jgi:signal peptidase I